uniref:Uncharacterized protein n=1 Tax=Trichogramma kaykai TaxID=54128 RepID=A0ABD2XAM9_9HYME
MRELLLRRSIHVQPMCYRAYKPYYILQTYNSLYRPRLAGSSNSEERKTEQASNSSSSSNDEMKGATMKCGN